MEHLKGWGKDWSTILFWKGEQREGEFGIGKWEALSPWWRDAWQDWLKLKCTPARNTLTHNHLLQWPVWNNRILSHNHGLTTTLRAAFSNSTTNAHMRTIRQLGLTTFNDFIHADGHIMNGMELYTDVTVRASVYNIEHVVPLRACATLSKLIKTLWSNAHRKWVERGRINNVNNDYDWWPELGGKKSFMTANNTATRAMIAVTERRKTPRPKLLKIGNSPIEMNWRKEKTMLSVLAPSRRDLMMRLVRNALPLGIKRIHWNTGAQTNCLLCADGHVETPAHLFWNCTYAKEVWSDLPRPWRNQNGGHIGWSTAVKGYEVRRGGHDSAVCEAFWTIIRACIVRTIWLERNRRYFYPTATLRSSSYRQNQAVDDMKIHIKSWIRRSDSEMKQRIHSIITPMPTHAGIYHRLRQCPDAPTELTH